LQNSRIFKTGLADGANSTIAFLQKTLWTATDASTANLYVLFTPERRRRKIVASVHVIHVSKITSTRIQIMMLLEFCMIWLSRL
jgi:hypothetical protein